MTEQQHNDTLANAINTGITSQGNASVSLTGAIGDNYFLADLRDDMDFYRFQGGAGDRIEWKITADGFPWYSADLVFGGVLYNADGNIIQNSNQRSSGTYAFILPTNGLYYLAAWGGLGRPSSGTFADVNPKLFPRSIGNAVRTGTYTLSLNLFDNTPNYPSPPPATLAIAATNASQTEGNSGSKAFTFTVTRAVNTTGTNNVNWAVTGTGTNPANATDFVGGILPSGVVSFAAGETSKVITVNVQGDTTVEPNENFTVTLSNATNGATITTATATGTINNDDFIGTSGPDTLVGTSGADAMTGLAGNDTYTVNNAGDLVIEALNQGTDTVQASISYTLPNNVENLLLTGTGNLNGAGNALNNQITGNSGNNNLNGAAGIDTLIGGAGNDSLNGAAGRDTLTGGLGADIFIFQFGQSTAAARDRVTDFAIGTDKIDLLSQAGAAINAPGAFTRATDSTTTNIDTIVTNVFTDANGATAGNQALGINSAVLVRDNSSSTYLIINDGTAGFQSANDLVINLTGLTGTLPALGTIPVNSFLV